MIVGEHIGEIRVGRVEGDLDLVSREFLDVLDRLHRAGRARLGLAAMQVQRIDRVVRVEILAVGEFDALAQVQHPFGGAVLALPARRQFGDRLAVGRPFDETVEQRRGRPRSSPNLYSCRGRCCRWCCRRPVPNAMFRLSWAIRPPWRDRQSNLRGTRWRGPAPPRVRRNRAAKSRPVAICSPDNPVRSWSTPPQTAVPTGRRDAGPVSSPRAKAGGSSSVWSRADVNQLVRTRAVVIRRHARSPKRLHALTRPVAAIRGFGLAERP